MTPELSAALAAWRALPKQLRFRILSTTGGCSEDEYRVIETTPKPTHGEYRHAQSSAAQLLRAASILEDDHVLTAERDALIVENARLKAESLQDGDTYAARTARHLLDENMRLHEVADAARAVVALFNYEPPVPPLEIRRLREAVWVLDEPLYVGSSTGTDKDGAR